MLDNWRPNSHSGWVTSTPLCPVRCLRQLGPLPQASGKRLGHRIEFFQFKHFILYIFLPHQYSDMQDSDWVQDHGAWGQMGWAEILPLPPSRYLIPP